MSENWTEGPWHVEIGTEDDDYGTVYVCHPGTSCPETVICKFEDYSDEQDRGNGYLIAAAPDMYAALDCLLAIVGLTAFKHESQRSVLQEAADNAAAALKKARGDE